MLFTSLNKQVYETLNPAFKRKIYDVKRQMN